jgi:hypothetical protein
MEPEVKCLLIIIAFVIVFVFNIRDPRPFRSNYLQDEGNHESFSINERAKLIIYIIIIIIISLTAFFFFLYWNNEIERDIVNSFINYFIRNILPLIRNLL